MRALALRAPAGQFAAHTCHACDRAGTMGARCVAQRPPPELMAVPSARSPASPPVATQPPRSTVHVSAPGASAAGRGGARITRRRLSEIGLGYTLLAPAVVLLLTFEVFPIVYGAYISACDWRLQCTQFVGLDNYTRALTDSAMWHALLVTATYALISVPLQLGLGLWIAYLLFQKVRGQEFFRVVFFLPYITSTVASAAVWSYLYSPDNGLINAGLRLIGLPVQHWLTEPRGVFALAAQSFGLSLPLWLQGPSL